MEEFNKLSLNDRAHILLEQGDYIESHTYYNYRILLYSLHKHFVELFYDRATNKIVWIIVANEHDLNKYLNKIELKF